MQCLSARVMPYLLRPNILSQGGTFLTTYKPCKHRPSYMCRCRYISQKKGGSSPLESRKRLTKSTKGVKERLPDARKSFKALAFCAHPTMSNA